MSKPCRGVGILTSLGWVLALGPNAQAVVTAIDATVTAEVNELVDGAVQNSDSAFEDLDETTGNLPLRVDTDLRRPEGDGEQAGALGTAVFYDPRLSEQPDPDEFGIDLSAFSLLSGVSYAGRGNSTETRTITFTSTDIGRPNGTALQARSFFFLDGMLTIWGDLDNTNLAGASAEVTLRVEQTRGGQTQEVLRAVLTFTGNADGSATLTTDGALVPDNVVVEDLSEMVPELGPVHLVLIPNIALPYTYSAAVGEEFTLRAEIEGRLSTPPFTGGSVGLGVPFLDLIEFINNVTGGQAGLDLQQVLTNAKATAPPPAKPLPAAEAPAVRVLEDGSLASRWLPPLCGNMAAESVLLAMGFAWLAVGTSRRR